MVSTSTMLAVCVTLFVSLVLPVIVYIVYGVTHKGKGVWTAWLLGAAGFFVMQVIIRLPVLSILSLVPGYQSFAQEHYVLYCLILALTAGLFEVAGRYAVAKIMKNKLNFYRGVAAGLGHGGIEAMLIVGLTYINNIIYILMINSGGFDALIEQTAALGVDTTSLAAVRESLIGTGAAIFYLAGYERILTMIFHTALSLLVCYFVWKKKDALGIVICLLLHGAVDFLSVILSSLSTEYLGSAVSQKVSYVMVYVFLTVVAVLSIFGIRLIRKKWAE